MTGRNIAARRSVVHHGTNPASPIRTEDSLAVHEAGCQVRKRSVAYEDSPPASREAGPALKTGRAHPQHARGDTDARTDRFDHTGLVADGFDPGCRVRHRAGPDRAQGGARQRPSGRRSTTSGRRQGPGRQGRPQRAKKDDKRILLMFGGDWCGWCHKLHELFASESYEISKILYNEYERSRSTSNRRTPRQLLKTCKAALSKDELQKGVGYPFLAVLDADGKVVTAQRTDPLEEGDHHDPKRVAAFLSTGRSRPRTRSASLVEALSRASVPTTSGSS